MIEDIYGNKESNSIRDFIHKRFIGQQDIKCRIGIDLYHKYGRVIWTDVGIITNTNIGIPVENNTVLEE